MEKLIDNDFVDENGIYATCKYKSKQRQSRVLWDLDLIEMEYNKDVIERAHWTLR